MAFRVSCLGRRRWAASGRGSVRLPAFSRCDGFFGEPLPSKKVFVEVQCPPSNLPYLGLIEQLSIKTTVKNADDKAALPSHHQKFFRNSVFIHAERIFCSPVRPRSLPPLILEDVFGSEMHGEIRERSDCRLKFLVQRLSGSAFVRRVEGFWLLSLSAAFPATLSNLDTFPLRKIR